MARETGLLLAKGAGRRPGTAELGSTLVGRSAGTGTWGRASTAGRVGGWAGAVVAVQGLT